MYPHPQLLSPTPSPPSNHKADANATATHTSALSIDTICRQHPRQRLIVPPLHWTTRQLDLLGGAFALQPSHSTTSWQRSSPPPSPKGRAPVALPIDHPLEASVDTLSRGAWYRAKQAALNNIFASGAMAITKTSERLFFCFESQAIRMPCTVFSCQPTSSPASSFIPTIAYLERDSLRVDRKASLDHIRIPRPTMRPSRPTASLYRAHLARITPADPIRDPYIAALLMALAQSQRRNLIRAGGLPANPNSFRVHVLVGDATDETRLHVYTANIPAASLDRLADSRWIPRAPISFVVHATEVPFGPYSSFQQRLLQTMFPEDKKRRRDAGTSRAEGVKVARVG